ncbi:hypothetical protein JJV70_04575 [Streptomyces sp. JJ66]|uniref:hypothetical protein n=1 Tax=Streptomyces sp. JJ66 TaxID=2803843 RepID=UPI001C5741C7|nr:hypothetical protein [Streptomyces sp. JJ66]MBW1601391.1 hypothetical protein [Streptomyces sp. JJ66]
MSTPSQHNPYGPPPQGPPPVAQPQYGYPQQPPAPPQPGYGYPQQPPAYPQQPGYPGGGPMYPGPPVPTQLPGKLKVLRVLIFVAGALQGLLSLAMLILLAANSQDAGQATQDSFGYNLGLGIFYTLFGLYLVHAVVGIVLAARFGQGGNGIRVGTIVWASFLTLFGVIAIPFGVLWAGLGITGIVFLTQDEAKAWFRRGQPGLVG